MSEKLPSPEEAMKILRESGCSLNVIRHCEAVAQTAVRIAKKCVENGANVDIDLIYIGALLHDLGRSETHGTDHPIVGARIARSKGLPQKIIRIIERHLGGGVSAEEACELNWPKGAYIPETLEEKIVTYADKLVEGECLVPIERTIQKLKGKLGETHPSIKRIESLHKEISKLCK
ncbi:MAG: TIGR00295 family protein [Candidatus Bathyarchaeia archaeon]